LRELAATARIGVTAGASAPPHLVDQLIATLHGLGPLTVHESAGVAENLQFTLPREVT
jgi:4-hydroxy-3-methylbut-2-enyl diphosphate reductase